MKEPRWKKNWKTSLSHIVDVVRARIPFVENNAVWQSLKGQGVSFLDVGCGKGTFAKQMISAGRNFGFTTGVDVFRPYLNSCKQEDIYHELVLCDCRNLPFRRKSFDLILCLQVIEHLDREDGIRLLSDLETIARHRVVIATPHGYRAQDSFEHNPFQKHRSGWLLFDFKARGYKVMGQGFRIKPERFGSAWNLIRSPRDSAKAPTLFIVMHKNLRFIPDIIVGPFVRRYTRLADLLICAKDLSD